MQSFGTYLKERRESKNVSLKDISLVTKITERYLDFIEKDEFEKVPGGAYIRGYISSYASFIGIDRHETLERFDSFCREKYQAEVQQEELSKEQVKRHPIMFLSNKTKWAIVCSAILILMTLGAIDLLSQDDKEATVVADFRSDGGKELQINDDIRSKDPQPMETTSSSTSNEETKKLPKELEDKKSDQNAHEKQLNREGQEISKPETLATTPQDGTGQDRSNPEKYIKVLETAVCTDVKDKNPFGKAYSVQWATDRVYVWNLLECEPGLSSIRHIYYFEGEKISDIALDIRSSRWRTWSYMALSDKRFIGTWRVDITSADGELLESVHFEVT